MTTNFDSGFYRNWVQNLDKTKLYQEITNLTFVIEKVELSVGARELAKAKMRIIKEIENEKK